MNSLTTRPSWIVMFRKVVDTCEKKLYDPKAEVASIGASWPEARKERILAAASDEELEREFNEMIKELKVSHAGFLSREAASRCGKDGHQRYAFSRRRRMVAPVGFFQDVHPGGAAFKAGVQPGDILLRVGEKRNCTPRTSVVSVRGNDRG